MAGDETSNTLATTAAAAHRQSFASGRYVVEALLGEGGQKTVYLAHDTQLDRRVAVAVMRSDGLDEDILARVRQEAQTMARLGAQPNVVSIFDIGDAGGAPYTVCEYLPGGDLRGALRKAGGPLPMDRIFSIAEDICGALTLAHRHGILHRDIKPENVWLTEDGRAKVGDFGLALAIGASRLTQAGTVMGTAAYMAPEQALGGAVDARCDLYALGCLIYEMATGRPPFQGDDLIAVVSQHINTAPVAPSWHQPDMPQALERLILRLLAKAPDQRAASATEVLAALQAIAAAPREAPLRAQANPIDRLAGGVFVGREQELAGLRTAFDEAFSGHGRLVLLAGEPGIGKSRLAEELATYAQVRGAQVLWGRCYEGEGAPAYWPWVQAIRSHVSERAPETLRFELGTGAADVAQIVSEVRERLPGLPDPPVLEPDQARFRLFDSITTFLKNAARSRPLVLVLDDLHWADQPSLLLLQFLARALRDARLLVLASYRDVELGRRHPLSHTLAELAREELSQRIVLRGLSQPDVARFIEMTAGIEPPAGLVTTVYRETEGNPFFVKEVVSLLASERRLDGERSAASWTVAIPQSVREVVGRRLDHLSAECNRVLTIASVIGREFSLDVLERVSGMEADPLLEVLDEAVAARVVGEAPRAPGGYSFSHALIRETLYDELAAARRVRFHRQIGEALEEIYSERLDPYLAELAYHFAEAARGGGDLDKAIEYAVRAGGRAVSLHAFEEAVSSYEMALGLADLKRPPDEKQNLELLIELGRAQLWKDGLLAKGTFKRAITKARQLHDPEGLARAAIGYSGRDWLLLQGEPERDAVLLMEEALAAIGEDDSALRAQLLSYVALGSRAPGSEERRDALLQDAVQMARRVGDKRALVPVLHARLYGVLGPDYVDERFAVGTELVQLERELKIPLWGNSWRFISLLERGDMPAFDHELEAWAGLFNPWYIAGLRAMRAIIDGRFDEGERLALEAFAIGQQSKIPVALDMFGSQMLLIRWEQGRLAELEALVAPLRATLRPLEALLHSEAGRRAETTKVFEEIVTPGLATYPRDALWLTGAVLLTHVCAYLGDAVQAKTLHDLMHPFAHLNATAPMGIISFGSTAQFLGMLATTMGRWDEAERQFQEGLARNVQMGARPWIAHTQYEYARMLLARGAGADRARANELVTVALDTAQQLGMHSLFQKAQALKTA